MAEYGKKNGYNISVFFWYTGSGEKEKQTLGEVLENVKCPVVTIGCKIGNHTSVCTDNYSGMRKLIEHFVIDHSMTKIHFVKGVDGNPDGEARYQAYVDVLTEHGISVLPERVTHGNFYVPDGELAVQDILTSKLDFPEAVVCANDIMAVTVCDGLMAHGYN